MNHKLENELKSCLEATNAESVQEVDVHVHSRSESQGAMPLSAIVGLASVVVMSLSLAVLLGTGLLR